MGLRRNSRTVVSAKPSAKAAWRSRIFLRSSTGYNESKSEVEQNENNMKKYLSLLFAIFIISGCAVSKSYIPSAAMPVQPPGAEGFYHKTEKGQTLWRISNLYGVSIDELAKLNKISDATQISAGQLLFIPQGPAAKKKTIQMSVMLEGVEKSDFIWPARGKVEFFYGSKKDGILNKGIDIYTSEGSDVAASRGGKVVFCDTKLKGYGQTIIIDHMDGFCTLYAYNSEVLVKPNEWVKQGQIIAKAGKSGRTQSDCLHFEIRKGDKPQNPFYFLPR